MLEQLPLFDDISASEPLWPFARHTSTGHPLRRGGYGFIMADPAWRFATWSDRGLKKSAQRHYSCMPLEDIKRLPVQDLAAPDCCLFLWATWPMLPQAMETMAAWGFDYRSGGAWHKRTKHGKTAFGTGYRVRCASEPFLLGFRGNPKNSKAMRNLIEGTVREHSRKPETAYAWAEAYLGGVARADLFSKEVRPNWESWGDEVGHYNQGDDDAIRYRQGQSA